jgi:hypothetical protein
MESSLGISGEKDIHSSDILKCSWSRFQEERQEEVVQEVKRRGGKWFKIDQT